MPEARIESHALGVSWVIKEPMQRGCHALVDQGKVWLIDPVANEDALAQAAGLGEPAAVVQLLDRHNRDCAAIAERLAVPHLKVPDSVPGSPFETIAAVRKPFWKETVLWWPERSALVVAEVLGTNALFTVGQAEVGMHPMLRPFAPGSLRGRRPEHLLVGHGHSIHGPEAAGRLEEAHARARRDIPQVVRSLPKLIRG